MAQPIKIRPETGSWVARAGGAVIAESGRVLELSEADYPPVIYFPRADVAMAFLDASDTQTTCPDKGQAQHFDLVIKSGTINYAAWSYETPLSDVAEITEYIAFYGDKVTVEKL